MFWNEWNLTKSGLLVSGLLAALHGRVFFPGDRIFIAKPPGIAQGPSQDELDLTVHTAQIVIGPAADGVQNLRVDAKQKLFAFGQGVLSQDLRWRSG